MAGFHSTDIKEAACSADSNMPRSFTHTLGRRRRRINRLHISLNYHSAELQISADIISAVVHIRTKGVWRAWVTCTFYTHTSQ